MALHSGVAFVNAFCQSYVMLASVLHGLRPQVLVGCSGAVLAAPLHCHAGAVLSVTWLWVLETQSLHCLGITLATLRVHCAQCTRTLRVHCATWQLRV